MSEIPVTQTESDLPWAHLQAKDDVLYNAKTGKYEKNTDLGVNLGVSPSHCHIWCTRST